MRNRIVTASLMGLLLAGCSLTAPLTPGLQNFRATGRAELAVEQAQLETTLGSLTGQRPLPGGGRITERGSADGRLRARDYLASRLTEWGYTPERQAYRPGAENLFVRLAAQTPTEDTILVGSHLDSVRNAGADDNGSGSSAVLEVARVLRDVPGRKVNLIFAWFDEEELGLIGSRAMARDLKKQGVKLLSVHTMDMLGWDKDGDRAIELGRPDGNLFDYYQMVNQRHGLNLPLVRTSTGQSDHTSFHEAGFASVVLSEEYVSGDFTPHYHQKTDTYETIDFAYLTAATRLVAATVGDLACAVPAPQARPLIPHEAFPGRDFVLEPSF